ncbi:RDD family protein [Parasphingorhabdus pacifica]
MSSPYGGPPPGFDPNQSYGPPSGPQPQQGYGPPSGPQPQQPYGPPSGPMQQAPYGAPPGHGGPPGFHPAGRLAGWGTRFLGYLIDAAIATGLLLAVVALIVLLVLIGVWSEDDTVIGVMGIVGTLLYVVGLLGVTAFSIWNLCYRRGITGQTIGQKKVKIKLVSEFTAQPIGFGNAFLRQLCHILDGMACSIGYFWPLWDEKNQTFADKIMTTVVIHGEADGQGVPPTGPPAQPGAYPPPGTPGGEFQSPGQPQQW